MNWLLKVATFNALSAVPGGTEAYRLLQERVTGGATASTERIHGKVDLGVRYLRLVEELSGGDRWRSMTHLDVGAGWIPAIPLLFYSAGMDHQVLLDVRPNIRGSVLKESVELFRRLVRANHNLQQVCRRLPPEVMVGEGVNSYLEKLGVRYVAPYRFQDIETINGPKLVTCTGVLPYVSEPILGCLLHVIARSLEGGYFLGVTHFYDDYALFDRSLPKFNRWRYSEFVWNRLVNSRLMSINRLTASNYRRLFEFSGLNIARFDLETPTSQDLEELARVPVHRSFRDVPVTELAAGPLLWAAQSSPGPSVNLDVIPKERIWSEAPIR
jgi:hypothetical protein